MFRVLVDKRYIKGPAVVEEPRLNATPFNVKRRADVLFIVAAV